MNILKLLKCDRLIITKEGLEQLVQNLRDRTLIRYKVGPHFNRDLTPSEIQQANAFNIKKKQKEKIEYDPSKPLKFKFKVLEEYLKEYETKRTGGEVNTTNDNKPSS